MMASSTTIQTKPNKSKPPTVQELVSQGLLSIGDVLRCLVRRVSHPQLPASPPTTQDPSTDNICTVGVVSGAGIVTPSAAKPLTPAAFANCTPHAAFARILAPNGRTLQALLDAAAAAAPQHWGLPSDATSSTPSARASTAAGHTILRPAAPLSSDLADETCRMCGFGGDIMICDSCPATFHPLCAGLSSIPEGEFFCPACRCAVCGNAHFTQRVTPACRGEAVSLPHDREAKGAQPPLAENGAATEPACQPAAASGLPMVHVPNHEERVAQKTWLDSLLQAAAAAAASTAPSAIMASCQQSDVSEAGRFGPAAATPPEDARRVICPGTGRAVHMGCLPPPQRLAVQHPRRVWYSDAAAAEAGRRLALACLRGATVVGEAGGVPLTVQLVHGAAVRQPEDVSGFFPALTAQQRSQQRRLLSAALAVSSAACPALTDTHTHLNMLPLLFQGWSGAGLNADFSTAHVAVLCAGGAVVGAAVLRLLGTAVAEVPLLVVRPDLQHNGLGRVLLAALERLCIEAGAQLLVMPGLLPFVQGGWKHAQHHTTTAATGHVCPEQALPLSWPSRCGYGPATVAQRTAAAQARSLFFPAAPLMGKALTHAAVTPCVPVIPGPLVLWCPGTTALPALVAGAKAVEDPPKAPAAPQWVWRADGTVVAGSEEAAVKSEGSAPVVPVVAGPEVKMEAAEGPMVAIKAEDLAAAAMAAAVAVMPVEGAGPVPPA